LKNGPAAAEQFRSILEHRGAGPTSALYALAHRGAARAAALTGDRAAARALYDQFFTLWSSADARRLVDQSRSEYGRLQ
jgi:glutamate synthase domain-containing protein 1